MNHVNHAMSLHDCRDTTFCHWQKEGIVDICPSEEDIK